MKKLLTVLFIAALVIGCSGPKEAEASHRGVASHEHAPEDMQLGIKADAPNLILLPKDWSFGLEGGKDLVDVNMGEGWFAYAKFTYNGTLYDVNE